MPRKSQTQKTLNGKIRCRHCLVWKPAAEFNLVVPENRAAYYWPDCQDCRGADKEESAQSAEVTGWPCQYCPKRSTCQSECFVYRAYVDGDVLHPDTLKKLIARMT